MTQTNSQYFCVRTIHTNDRIIMLSCLGTESPTDADWDVFQRHLHTQMTMAASKPHYKGLHLIAMSDGGGPTTLQRKRNVELMDQFDCAKVRSSIITNSRIARGVATAFQWLTGQDYLRAFAPDKLSTALDWLGLSSSVQDRVWQEIRAAHMQHPLRVTEDAAKALGKQL